MNLEKEQYYFLRDVGLLLDYISHSKFEATFGEAFRTQEQADIYAKEGKGIHDSLHCKRLAIDLNFFVNGEYTFSGYGLQEFGNYWESLDKNNRWGGYFTTKYGGHINDPNHFERKPE